MPNIEDNLFDDEEFSETELPKKLRAKIKELAAELNDAKSENTTLKTESRKRLLSETLESRGLSSKIAQFIPIDLDDDGVSEWLNENAEVFGGGQVSDAPKNTVIARDSEQAHAIRQMANSERGATTGQEVNTVMNGIENAGSMEELMAVLKQV
jgi:hypothetical protein